jgi:hypothetical protein
MKPGNGENAGDSFSVEPQKFRDKKMREGKGEEE